MQSKAVWHNFFSYMRAPALPQLGVYPVGVYPVCVFAGFAPASVSGWKVCGCHGGVPRQKTQDYRWSVVGLTVAGIVWSILQVQDAERGFQF
jgi:prolipoprotein diacylglyceryltransferase